MAHGKFAWLGLFALGLSLPALAATPKADGHPAQEPFDTGLHDALIAMDKPSSGPLDTASVVRLKALIHDDTWPSVARIGRDGVDAGGRLVERAGIDSAFQQTMLHAMLSHVGIDIDAHGYAALCDRIDVSHGQPQEYGTLLALKNGRVVTSPFVTSGSATESRDSIGLSFMDARLAEVQAALKAGRSFDDITRTPALSMAPQWPSEPALRQELRDMFKADQQVRRSFVESGMKQGSPQQKAVIDTDARHVARIRTIVDQYGFPSPAMVGRNGSAIMLLLADHIEDDDALMGRVLELSRPLVDKGLLSHALYATVIDRHLVLRHKPQIYGTQADIKDGHSVPLAMVDPAHLEARRAAMGMEPEADYLKENDEAYQADSTQSKH